MDQVHRLSVILCREPANADLSAVLSWRWCFCSLGGDWLVKGAVGLAERLNISPLIIGLTVVALGTSAPELVVSLQAALEGSGGLAVGNVVGSNIANVLLVVGIPALFCPYSRCQSRGSRFAFLSLWSDSHLYAATKLVTDFTAGRSFVAGLSCSLSGPAILQRQKIHNNLKTIYHDEIGAVPSAPYRIAALIALGLIGPSAGRHIHG